MSVSTADCPSGTAIRRVAARFSSGGRGVSSSASVTLLSVVMLFSACATAPPAIDEALTEPPVRGDCTPAYAGVFEGNASMTPIQAEVWLRNIIREPAYSPLGNELIARLSEGRDSDWASLTIGRDLTRTGSSYRFYLHDGLIIREELTGEADSLSDEAAQTVDLDITDCEREAEGVVDS